MSTHSIDEREWARVDDTTAGSRVKVDGDFTCIAEGAELVVQKGPHGLYVPCSDGCHYLDGQENDEGTHYVGMWPVRAAGENGAGH